MFDLSSTLPCLSSTVDVGTLLTLQLSVTIESMGKYEELFEDVKEMTGLSRRSKTPTIIKQRNRQRDTGERERERERERP